MFFAKSLERKKICWEGHNFVKKHDIKLKSHEKVSIEFENHDITETPTFLVLNQGENYRINKITEIGRVSMNKPYRTTTRVKRFCLNLKNIVINRKETILLKSFLKTSQLRQAEND